MSTNQAENPETLLEQDRLAPLKIFTQHASGALTAALGKNPELEVAGQANLETAKKGAAGDTDFDSVNYKMVAGSTKAAEKAGADVIFFTNENQDQLGVSVRKEAGGPFRILTGHQIALILSEVVIEQYLENGKEEEGKEPYILKSIVLSDVLEMQAAYKKVRIIQTFSGLEELNRSLEECGPEADVLLAMDEANHFIFPGLSAAESIEKAVQLLAEKALALKKEGETLFGFLTSLYKQYGFFQEKSFTIGRDDKSGEKHLKGIMDEIRRQSPDFLFGQTIRQINDYHKRTFYNLLTAKKGKMTLPKTDVLQFLYADNTKITLVPADDYSKLFYHFSVSSRLPGKDAFEEARQQANDRIVRMMEIIGKF